MYEEFYGLKMKPFQVVPDPAFLYWSGSHSMAFTMLHYSILSGSPLTVITGDVGTGKTTLLRQMLREFPGEIEAGLISNIQAGKGELLEWALMAFGKPYGGRHVQRFQRFQDFLIERYAAGKQIALIVDEAQNLGMEQLEELRMLSNINADQDHILRIILVGQPELRDVLDRPDLRQFTQRVTADFHLQPLEAHDVHGYIHRRLSVAGADRTIFASPACDLIFHATGGIPRLVNVLCDLCLVYGFSADRDVIEEDLLHELLSDLERNGTFRQFTPPKGPLKLVPIKQVPATESTSHGSPPGSEEQTLKLKPEWRIR